MGFCGSLHKVLEFPWEDHCEAWKGCFGEARNLGMSQPHAPKVAQKSTLEAGCS